jgi:pimeloyl-ACP methyl ester carboxylesterase
MARFVLVHGAWAGAWIWEPLTERLEKAGHTVSTLDLPGSGDDLTPVEEVTLDAYADRVCAVLGEDPEPAILVGNSMGGVAITQAASRCPERVASLIYLTAFLPWAGQSLKELTELPEGAEDHVQATMVVEGEPPVAKLSDEDSKIAFYLACSEEVAAESIARQRPQPVLPFITPVELGGEEFEQLPRHYVICTQDRAIPPALQRRMVREAGITDVVELDTDHHLQLSATDELAEVLDNWARAEAAT